MIGIEALAETVVTLAASGYAITKVMRDYRTMSTDESVPVLKIRASLPPIDTKVEDRRLAQLFIDVPSAFWLDPNLYGDNPDWREKLFPDVRRQSHIENFSRQTDDMAKALLGEPDCGECIDCGEKLERFTWHGTWFRSCTNRKCRFYETGWAEGGRWIAMDENANWYEIKKTYTNDTTLPCGCVGDIVRGREPYTGYHFSRCVTCSAEWEPQSNDPTGRSLAQGEKVNRYEVNTKTLDHYVMKNGIRVYDRSIVLEEPLLRPPKMKGGGDHGR